MGGSFAIYKKLQDYFANTQGQFQFNGQYSGRDFADFLLGTSNQYQEQVFKGVGYWNAISSAAYIHDNWRATHPLTLNLGLRWDGIPHTYEANNNMSNFYPNRYNPALAPLFVPGTNDTEIAPA
jgi:outer membrane receptor protein involved in Fe transport